MSTLPIFEITMRKFERPTDLDKRALITLFCTSLGLINPGDSRKGIIDVFEVLFDAKTPLSAEEIGEKIPGEFALSGLRRHLKRLETLQLVEHRNKKYSLAENGDFAYFLTYRTKKYIIDDIFERILEYGAKLEELRKKS